jgi:hypothetical protein
MTPAQPLGEQTPARVPRRYVGAAPAGRRSESREPYKPDPAWNKALIAVGVAVVALALLVVPGIVNRGGKNPVAQAAQATLHWPGARMSFSATGTGPGASVSMQGSGVMNGETNRALIQISATANGAGASREFRASQVDDGPDFYFNSPELSATIGQGAPWLLIRGEALGSLAQQSGNGGFMRIGGVDSPSGPREQLNLLNAASSDVRSVGQETVRGAVTTRYTGTIDLQRLLDSYRDQLSDKAIDLFNEALAEAKPQETVDVWIDDQDLIRRESATVSGATGRMTTTIEFYDFGIHPRIDVPPPSEVRDVTPLLQEALKPLVKD